MVVTCVSEGGLAHQQAHASGGRSPFGSRLGAVGPASMTRGCGVDRCLIGTVASPVTVGGKTALNDLWWR